MESRAIIEIIAREMGRTVSSVSNKYYELGLARKRQKRLQSAAKREPVEVQPIIESTDRALGMDAVLETTAKLLDEKFPSDRVSS